MAQTLPWTRQSAAPATRVLFATTHIHLPQGGGGGEQNTHELCLALLEMGFKVGVMSSLSANGTLLSEANRLKRFVLRQGYPTDHACGYPTYRGWRQDGLREVVARFHPDVVVVQDSRPEAMVAQLRELDIPHAVYIHEVEEVDHLRPLGEAGVRFIANSRFTAARLRERCGIDAVVVRPIIEPNDYRVDSTRERALFVNTVPRKGLEVALDMARARPDIPFDMVLSWILKPEQVQALRDRAPANVTFHPPTPDMRPLYAKARVLLAPSQWEEAWGRVATEAQVSGIPVLGSLRGGLPEAVGPGGILLPASAPRTEWIAALGRLWDDQVAYANYAAAALAHGRRPEVQPGMIVSDLARVLDALARDARSDGARPGRPQVGEVSGRPTGRVVQMPSRGADAR